LTAFIYSIRFLFRLTHQNQLLKEQSYELTLLSFLNRKFTEPR